MGLSRHVSSDERMVETTGKEKRNFAKLWSPISRTWLAAKRISRCIRKRPPPHTADSRHGPKLPLPQELLDYIVDFLHDDKQSLRNCSLAFRALIAPARYHLFHAVLVHAGNYRRAASFFVHRAPEVALYVRKLRLETKADLLGLLRNVKEGEEVHPSVRRFFADIAPLAKNVEVLALKDVSLDRPVVEALTECFPHMKTLYLFDCWFRCNADLDRVIRSHPALRTVRCGRLSSLHGLSSPDEDLHIGPPIRISEMKVTEAYSPSPLTLMPWFVPHLDPEYFIYTLYRYEQFTKLNHWLNELQSLRHLHIIIYRWRQHPYYLDEGPGALSLFANQPLALTTLTIDGRIYSTRRIVILLANLDPASFVRLATLNLCIHLQAEELQRIDEWAGMDQTLSVLLSLSSINVFNTCTDSEHVHDGRETLEARLPIMGGVRRLLRFRDEPAPELNVDLVD